MKVIYDALLPHVSGSGPEAPSGPGLGGSPAGGSNDEPSGPGFGGPHQLPPPSTGGQGPCGFGVLPPWDNPDIACGLG